MNTDKIYNKKGSVSLIIDFLSRNHLSQILYSFMTDVVTLTAEDDT